MLLTQELFETHVGEPFTIVFADGVEVEADLSDVRGLKGREGQPRAPFALTFSTTVGASGHPGQGTYTVRHGELGELAIFLVPISARDGAVCYEAVFN